MMDTYIAYFDETGDDGVTTKSSEHFVLTSMYMPVNSWQDNFNRVKELRRSLKEKYGFHTTDEMHTKHFLTDKNPYRNYGWTREIKQEILKAYAETIAAMDVQVINVIIDKTKFVDGNYRVLENALKYNIQRIENDSAGKWNYIIITDEGRLSPMRKTARSMRAYNPIHSRYSQGYSNQPLRYLIEDILEKDSAESHFIQIADYISYFVHLRFTVKYKEGDLPNRVKTVVDEQFVEDIVALLRDKGKLNLKANPNDINGFVIYPK